MQRLSCESRTAFAAIGAYCTVGSVGEKATEQIASLWPANNASKLADTGHVRGPLQRTEDLATLLVEIRYEGAGGNAPQTQQAVVASRNNLR